MFIMKKLFYIICLLPVLLASCYDDEGNYDYHEINKIEGVTGGVDSVIYIRQFDTLRCTPEFTGTQYSNPEAYSYEWEIETKIVSTDFHLVYPVIQSSGDKNCRLIITDKEQGNQYIFPFHLIVSGERSGDMILVLSSVQGKAEMSYKGLRPDTTAFVVNYYERSVGSSLGTAPRRFYRNYMPIEAFSGLLVLTDEGMKSLADTTLEEVGTNTWLDENFLKRQRPYPQPSVPGFSPEMLWSGITEWEFFGGQPTGNPRAKNIIVSEGKLYFFNSDLGDQLTRNWLLDVESPYGGKLSPFYFPVSRKANTFGFPDAFFLSSLGYTFSDYGVMFDETAGRFLLVSGFGYALKEIPENKIPAYEGWRLLYGSHTNLPKTCVAMLGKEEVVKALLLQLPENGSDATEMKVLAEMDMPVEAMNARSDFYNYRTQEFILVSAGNRLLTGNIREWESGTAPQPVFSLSDIGYDNSAEITCFEMSRTEKTIVLGVSRYGNDRTGNGEELKGDVVVLDAATFRVKKDSLGEDMIFRGVCGYPVDIMVKWQNWYRDGKDQDGKVMDIL